MGLSPETAAEAWLKRLRREVVPISAALVLTVGLWAFLSVADEVAEGETHAVDLALLMSLRQPGDPAVPIGPHWLTTMAMDITSMGSLAVLGLVVMATCGLFLALRRYREALILVVASGGGLAISQTLKMIFARDRPDAGLHLVEAINASFPSGHAMLSASVYLTLGALTARFASRRRVKTFVMTSAVIMTGLVGVSRVYLGVHWPTDVLAGWCVGASWAMVCWLTVWVIDRRWPSQPGLDEAQKAGTTAPL